MPASKSFFSSWYEDEDELVADTQRTWNGLLAHEEKVVLYKLIQLADGQIMNYGGSTGKRKPGSVPPPDRISLYAFHEKKFAEARSKFSDGSIPAQRLERLRIITEAERDYWTAKKRPPVYNDVDSDENKRQRDEAILRWKGQRPAQWVAVMEGCSAAHVYRLWKARKDLKNSS